MNDIKQIAYKLFQFLKEFNELKRKPQLDVSAFEKTFWFYEIPKEKECFSITHKIESENFNKDTENFNKWIQIKKPKKPLFPDPPEKIKPWLKNDTWNKHTEQPQLFSYIIRDFSQKTQNNEDKNEILLENKSENEEGTNKLLLEDFPEIKKTFENYLNQKWIPWSQEEKRLTPVYQAYNSLYEIYNKNKYKGETYQIVLGLGLLICKNQKERDIRRHIVTTPLSIDFNSVNGTITVSPCDQSTELSLEMDMFSNSEKPKNCDEINFQLSNLSNDFWINEAFSNCLKSWLNSYDSDGQFIKNFDNPISENYTILNISPSIILRKRNERVFLKFYDSVLKNIEEREISNRPCLNNLIERKPSIPKESENSRDDKNTLLNQKYYFPLSSNEEQKKIMDKVLHNSQVVVQGPPGTGKTHSIANLICDFLARGKKILVTSQTDRALKVLKNKLPEKIKPLCVEILGKDQRSFQELKASFEVINSEWQRQDRDQLLKDINKLEKKDDDLFGKLVTIKNKLTEIKNIETKKFNKFDFYEGTLANISTRVKHEEEKYKWIKENFNFNNYNEECPISNDEALSFLKFIRNLKTTEDSIFEEPIEFINHIFTPQKFKEEAQRENEARIIIENHEKTITSRASDYKNLKKDEFNQLQKSITSLYPKAESLLNRNEKWVKQALNDCLADRDREWVYLYDRTNKILDENKDLFSEADKIYTITISSSKAEPNDLFLINLLEDFFKRYKPNDKIRWGWFCSKNTRNLKKIKINEKYISSYKEVIQFKNYITAKRSLKKLKNFWKQQGINTDGINNQNFTRNYHIFKDFCEPLNECIFIHKLLADIKGILSKNNITQPFWDLDTIKQEKDTLTCVSEQKTLEIILDDFKHLVSSLKPYRNQKNQMASKIISAVESRNSVEYKNILDEISAFQEKKKKFDKLCQIKNKLKNNMFYLNLKKESENCQWDERLKFFKEAWTWQKADLWLEEKTSENFYHQLDQERKELLEKKKKNMENLASSKAWHFCLSNITESELSSLRALIQSIAKIGKGTGKSAPRHRKIAREKMEECKSAIPAWIMPLYRVVENISPDTKPFDVVIIDEASQTGPDGFLINYLAKKIIVVGDKEQISPEHAGLRDEEVEILKKEWLSDIKSSDYIGKDYSYYDYCEILFTGSHVQLREHFRCMPEIILFSNQISYTGIPLVPLRQYGASRLDPLKNTFVPDAVSSVGLGRQPQNEKEAQVIIDQIQKCIQDPNYKEKSFGIISLQGEKQVKVIEKLLLQIDKGEIEKRNIQVGSAYDFQGDERDVIFLSMAVGKDWNISALTKETDKRRYNVAVSRAKDQIWLFHSVEKNDLINREDFRRKLLDHLSSKKEEPKPYWPQEKLNELYEKIKNTVNKNPENAPESFESWFEARVFYEIALKGYQVIPQYEGLGFRIDMVIVDSKRKLAVECDGDYWHNKETEGKDLERQWQLERCGWTFWRLRESVFNRDKEKALKPLWDKLDKMNNK